MKKLSALFLGLLLILTLALTGCGTQKTSTEKPKSASTSKDIKANLRFLWPGTSEPEKKVALKLQEKVKKDYPGINIEFVYLNWTDIEKKMTVMVKSGDAPDLMLIQDITNPVAMGALEPLDSNLNDKVKKSNYLPASWKSMGKDGKQYGIPGLAIIYSHVANTDLLAKAGYKVDDLKTWDDINKASHAIKALGKSGYAMANGGEGRFSFRDLMMVSLSNGITPDQVDPKHKKQYLEVLKEFKDLSSDMPKSQVTWLYPELFKAWEAGDIGFMHTGNYFTPNVIANGTKSMNWTEPFAFPAGPSVDKTKIMVGTVGVSMLKGSKNKEAAWKVIEELMSPDVLGLWGGSINASAGTYVSPAILEDAAKTVYPEVYKQHLALNEKWTKLASEYGTPVPSILGQQPMEKVVQDALVKLTNGDATPEQAYDEIKSGIEKVKEQFKQ
jgi:multiple sugar transport system substrate-binding protein